MNEVSIVGVDLAKRVFQLHGSRADGTVAFRKKVNRDQVLTVLAGLPNLALKSCNATLIFGDDAGLGLYRVTAVGTSW